METQKTSAKDFFINLGAIVALGVVVGNLIGLLFTVINRAYPPTTGYDYGSYSISFPAAWLIIFFPVYILLMWLLERSYKAEPEKRKMGVRKWLTYITLFLAGLAIAIDLATVLYYFLDGRDLTAGFILKALSVLVVAAIIFFYYISDMMDKLSGNSRKVWTGVSLVIILASVVWGFSVLGSPLTQRLFKYDEQKVNELTNIKYAVENYYQSKGVLPNSLTDLSSSSYYPYAAKDQQGKPYEYQKTGTLSYDLCADFNKESPAATGPNIYMRPVGYPDWTHPAGRYCFAETINPNMYTKPAPAPLY